MTYLPRSEGLAQMIKSVLRLTELAQIEDVVCQLKEKLMALNIPQEAFYDIQLALTEAIGNAFLHGTRGADKPQVEVEWLINNDSISFKVKDNGPGFSHGAMGNLDDNMILAEKGKGLFLIYNVIDQVRFNQKGNEIYCFKKWRKKDFILEK